MAAALCACPVRGTGFDGAGLKVFGLTKDQRLVKFRGDRPRRLQNIGPIAGLNSPDTALVGIDFRVQDGNLYGLGTVAGPFSNAGFASLVVGGESRFYSVTLLTGRAFQIDGASRCPWRTPWSHSTNDPLASPGLMLDRGWPT